MNWKSTALVSGATLLAGWLAAERPATQAPPVTKSSATQSPQTAAAASDIEHQAARLQSRTREASAFREPERNLFQFRPKALPRIVTSAPVPSGLPPAEIVPPPPPPPRVSLSGIASDQDGQRTVRTAVLSTPGGVLLVHEGDDVLGQYRVATIGEDAVELTRVSDGTPLRLILRP